MHLTVGLLYCLNNILQDKSGRAVDLTIFSDFLTPWFSQAHLSLLKLQLRYI